MKKGTLIKYLLAILAGAVFAVSYGAGNAVLEQEATERWRILCDAFSAPGMLMILFGMLFGVVNQGALDSLSFLGQYVIKTFIPFGRDRIKSYREYLEEKDEKRIKGYGFLYIVGALFLAVGLVFLMLYHQ